MVLAKLMDPFGFSMGEPEIPAPFPEVAVWGNDFYINGEVGAGDGRPLYHQVYGVILTDLKDVQRPYPKVAVLGAEFYVAEEVGYGVDLPNYRQTTGFVIVDTKETGSGVYKLT